jgi:hypothetical protein
MSVLLLPQVGTCSRIQAALKTSKYTRLCDLADYNGKPISYQTMMFGESVIKVKSTWPELHDIVKECATIHDKKPHKHNPLPPYPKQLSFVEIPRHNTWGLGLEHEYDDEPIYKDCLCGVEWLKEHIDFKMPEPLIEITVDGGSAISVDGNYKRGMIGDFIEAYYIKNKGFTFYKDTGGSVPNKKHPAWELEAHEDKPLELTPVMA